MLLELKKKIIEANPDILKRESYPVADCELEMLPTIRLTDILLALKGNKLGEVELGDYYISGSYLIFVDYPDDNEEEKWSWNLRDDNLDHQSEETIKFLHSILCQ